VSRDSIFQYSTTPTVQYSLLLFIQLSSIVYGLWSVTLLNLKAMEQSSARGNSGQWRNIILGILLGVIGLRVVSMVVDSLDTGESKVSSGLSEDLDYTEVEELYDTLRENYNGELSEQDLINGLKAGLIKGSGDPYTVYLSQEEREEFDSSLNGSFSGIGAELGAEEDHVLIVSPLDGFPAQKAGVQTGDIILAVDGVSMFGESVEKVVSVIRGEAGTDVELDLRRDNQTIKLQITREEIDIPSVTWENREDVGYIRLSRFANDTSELAGQAIKELESEQVKGYVLDLRNNGGGYLESAVEVAGLWLDDKIVVQQEQNGEVGSIMRSSKGSSTNKQTVVLVNEGSASASEILAAALQETGSATLLGETTFGKGTVQQLLPLDDNGTLKVTIAQWLTTEGNKIDGVGIEPDTESIDSDLSDEVDEVFDEAADLLK